MTTFLFFGVFGEAIGGGGRNIFLSEKCLEIRKTGILLPRVVTLSPYVMADLYNPHRQELELTELGAASRTAIRWSCPRTVPNRRRTATA